MNKIKKENTGFTQVSNIILNDRTLSLKAKGLYAYLFSKPNGWDFSGDRICEESLDGRLATYNALKELERNGYIQRERQNSGKMTYRLLVKPNVENRQEPNVENRKVRKPQSAKIDSISNKEKKIIKKNSNKELLPKGNKAKPTHHGRKDINQLLQLIEKITPLDGSKRMNRFYLKNFLDSKMKQILISKGVENPTSGQKINGVLRIFEKAKNDDFHRKKITSLKYIYNHAYEIIEGSKNRGIKIHKL